jgi:PAS domain S-box-containing protein
MGNNSYLEFEQIPLCVIDKDFNIIRVSNALSSLLQMKRDEIIGKKCYDTISGQFCNNPRCTLKQILGGREYWEYEKDIKLSDGIMITCIMRAVPYWETDDEVIGVLQNYTDISKHKKFEEKLKKSEEKYHHLFEKTPYIVILINSKGKIIDFNQTTLKYLIGYVKEDLIDKDFRELNFIPLKHTEILKEKYNELLIKGYTEPLEFYMGTQKSILKGSGLKWIELQTSLVKVKEENLIQIIIKDITAKKEAEQKLKESEEKYRLITENANDFIIIFDKNFTIEYITDLPSFKMLGYTRDDFIGKRGIIFVHPDDLEKVLNAFKKGIERDEAATEARIKHKDGYYIWVEAKGKMFIDIDNKTKVLINVRDITKRKEADEKLKKSEEKYHIAYDQANFFKDLFLHDMNNILSVIYGAISLFSIHPNDPKQLEESFEIIQNQVTRAIKLVSNVQKLSQLEDSEVSLQSTKFCKFLKDSINFLNKSFPKRKINLQVDAPSKELFVRANDLLLDVFENILINAVKYNDKPIVEIFIKISEVKEQDLNYLKMEFIDNGIGISDVMKEKIFQKGYQKDISVKGMGIGLSLVKKIIESYNGKIWVENKVKEDYLKGSNFILLIPRAP